MACWACSTRCAGGLLPPTSPASRACSRLPCGPAQPSTHNFIIFLQARPLAHAQAHAPSRWAIIAPRRPAPAAALDGHRRPDQGRLPQVCAAAPPGQAGELGAAAARRPLLRQRLRHQAMPGTPPAPRGTSPNTPAPPPAHPPGACAHPGCVQGVALTDDEEAKKAIEDKFKRVQEAYETLSDPAKVRRALRRRLLPVWRRRCFGTPGILKPLFSHAVCVRVLPFHPSSAILPTPQAQPPCTCALRRWPPRSPHASALVMRRRPIPPPLPHRTAASRVRLHRRL